MENCLLHADTSRLMNWSTLENCLINAVSATKHTLDRAVLRSTNGPTKVWNLSSALSVRGSSLSVVISKFIWGSTTVWNPTNVMNVECRSLHMDTWVTTPDHTLANDRLSAIIVLQHLLGRQHSIHISDATKSQLSKVKRVCDKLLWSNKYKKSATSRQN